MKHFIKALAEYAAFNGRAGRKEYWLFILFFVIFEVIANILDHIFGFISISYYGYYIGWIYVSYIIVMIIPLISATFRRLHDTGRSGTWILLSLIPIVGKIILIIILCQRSVPEQNKYGSFPHDILPT